MDPARALTNTLRRGDVLVDPTTTIAVKYLDCSAFFDAGEKEIVVRILCTKDLFVIPVDKNPPAAPPTTAEMDLIPAATHVVQRRFAMRRTFSGERIALHRSAPVLAYSANAGALYVRRTSPRQA